MEVGVEGTAGVGPPPAWALRSGEGGRRSLGTLLVETPRIGELLRSGCLRSGSRTEVRTGEGGGNDSSRGFRGVRILLGEPEGLLGRSCGEYRIWPEPLTPGADWVREMGGARLAAERDLE